MRGDEDVLCGGTCRDDLLDGGHAAMLAQLRGDDNEQRRAHRLRALLGERRFSNGGIAPVQRIGQNFAKRCARRAVDDDEVPGPQPAVIGGGTAARNIRSSAAASGAGATRPAGLARVVSASIASTPAPLSLYRVDSSAVAERVERSPVSARVPSIVPGASLQYAPFSKPASRVIG